MCAESPTRVILVARTAVTLVYCMLTVSILHTAVGGGDYGIRLPVVRPVSATFHRQVAHARLGKKLAAARRRLLDRIRALQDPADCAAARYIECQVSHTRPNH